MVEEKERSGRLRLQRHEQIAEYRPYLILIQTNYKTNYETMREI